MKDFKLNSLYTLKRVYIYDTLRQCPVSDISEDKVKYLLCTKLQLYFCIVNVMYSFVALWSFPDTF